MAPSKLNNYGWIVLDVDEAHEKQAREFRAKRDRLYGNIYSERETDERWVGDLGEFAFKSWLNQKSNLQYEWIKENAAGKADFIINPNISVGVKTVKRQAEPKINYTAQITAKHAKEPTDYFFFLSYDFIKRQMWFLGGIGRQEFLNHARYHRAGEWVHSNYQIREGHEIYNGEIMKLTPPTDWLHEMETF